MNSEAYQLKPGYSSRSEYVQFDDRTHTMEWQAEVYIAARSLFDAQGLRSVIDIGCGAAFKLMYFFKDAHTIGLDLEPNLSFLRERYPERIWKESNLNVSPTDTAELVIASDIVEHLLDPDLLLNYIRAIRAPWTIISTPERDAVQGAEHFGPPENVHHVREWNHAEFQAYVSRFLPVRSGAVIGLTQFLICGSPDEL